MVIDPKDIKFGTAVASGSYGRVYHGTWIDDEVAIKEIRASKASDVRWIDDQEVLLMLRLRHPRIVRFHGAGVRHFRGISRKYLVFEWMAGGSLRDRLNNPAAASDWNWRLLCARDIALGIQFLHKKGFVHRDIKTDNVLLDTKGRAKVADFGCGRAIATNPGTLSDDGTSSEDSYGKMTAAKGTPMYMAPELLTALLKRSSSHVPM